MHVRDGNCVGGSGRTTAPAASESSTPTPTTAAWLDPKTELVTERIARITPRGIVTDDGWNATSDVIVFATRLPVSDSYLRRHQGAGGEDLDRWNREGVQAHRGITVADVPNLFFLLGPNTGLGHNSVVFMIESQIRYVAQAIAAVDKAACRLWHPPGGAGQLQRRAPTRPRPNGVEHLGGCRSWYLDEHGRTALWSGMTWEYWPATRSLSTGIPVQRTALNGGGRHNGLCWRAWRATRVVFGLSAENVGKQHRSRGCSGRWN